MVREGEKYRYVEARLMLALKNVMVLALEKLPDQVWLHQQVSYKRGSRLLHRWLQDQRR